MKQSVKDYKRIVVKIGSSLFYSQDRGIDESLFRRVCDQVKSLTDLGKEVVIVSSGAIALGMGILKLRSRPKELSYLQAAAALGQNALIDSYSKASKDIKINFAQVLLTWEDFDDRKRYLNAKNTLSALLKLKCVPIVNENDTVSTDEIKFGDNDRLSALVAALINADLLIILSDVDGLLEKDRKTIRKIVPEINSEIRGLICPTNKQTCVGGMVTKIEAAKIAVDSGIPCVIANGRSDNIIMRIAKDYFASGTWTLFVPKKDLAAKKRWIAFSTKPKGKVMVDDGAKKALLNKKSLLCVGVIGTAGVFACQDIVSIIDKLGEEFARGKVGISSEQLEGIKGRRFDKEVVHCDNIVILEEK